MSLIMIYTLQIELQDKLQPVT